MVNFESTFSPGEGFGTTSYSYVYNGGQLSQMTVTTVTETADGQTTTETHTVDLTYDASGNPQTITYDGTTYYYTVNIQGDVTGIVDENGTVLARYTYLGYGATYYYNVPTDSIGPTLRQINPLTYRGYVYDKETKLYYLQSRYYNRTSGRFINADAFASTGQGLLGNNMFAYCLNNPVNMRDASGHLPQWLEDIINWTEENLIDPFIQFCDDVEEDYNAYDESNKSEEVMHEANYFFCYNGKLVILTPLDSSFSFGIIGLSRSRLNADTLKHEYGHAVQLDNMGVVDYVVDVAIPSATINILGRMKKLPYDYYSYPWEAEANELGGSALSQSGKPKLPQDGYVSYWDLVKLFFK